MKKNFYIDSIDCDVAHIVEEESEKSYVFPVALLPKGSKEDQWFSLEICKLEQKELNLKNEIENMFDLLEQRKHIENNL
ncbi:MAG: hypothetical protein Q4C78_06065 [Synergistaceae bacterium]|nr:hypothetical protein [Synergistaceae bacterium]